MDLRVYHALEDLVKKVFDETIDTSDYLKRSEKSAVNGVASLDGSTLVPTAELGTGVADGTTFLRGDGTWVVAGITDHGGLSGLTDDDHSIYALLAGRAGGQTQIGDTASGGDLILQSTSNAVRGDVRVNAGGLAVYLLAADAEPMFRIDGVNDYLLWGPGGAGGLDVRMIHSAKKLSLDDNASGSMTFAVEGILRAEGLSGTAVAAIDLDDGATIGAGATGEVRLRSNGGVFEISENGAAFAAPGGVADLQGAYDGGNNVLVVASTPVQFRLDGGSLPSISTDTALVIANTSLTGDNVGLSLISGATGKVIINLGDTDDEDSGSISYDNNGSPAPILSFEVGTSPDLLTISNNPGIVINEAGSSFIDVRMESDNSTNMVFVDAGADRVVMQKDNGSLPTLSGDTALVIANTSVVGDNVEISIISGTSGQAIINLGDTANEDAGEIIFDNTSAELRFQSGSTSLLTMAGNPGIVFNEQGVGNVDLRYESDNDTHFFFLDGGARNAVLCGASAIPNFQAMVRGIFLGDVDTAPTGNPSAGGFMYSNAGAGTWRGSSGQVTAFGPAGPHCSGCGHDNWRLAQINMNYESWIFDCARCGMLSKGGPDNILDDLTEHQKTEIVGPSSTFADVCKAMGIAA